MAPNVVNRSRNVSRFFSLTGSRNLNVLKENVKENPPPAAAQGMLGNVVYFPPRSSRGHGALVSHLVVTIGNYIFLHFKNKHTT